MNAAYFYSNAHTHCTFCDGKCPAEEMVQAALAKGFHTLGFSGHSQLSDTVWAMRNQEGYRAEIARLKEVYQGKINLLCGVEWDADSNPEDLKQYEYFIGSVHRIHGPRTGRIYEVDYSYEMLNDCVQAEFGGDGLAMAKHYFVQMEAMIERHPDILGHMDLIRKYNRDNCIFNEDDPAYRAAALHVLEKAARENVLVELNTGGAYRGCRTDFYPADYLLPSFAEMGGRLILTSDSHDTNSLGYQFVQAAEKAKQAGFRELSVLTGSGFVPVSIE